MSLLMQALKKAESAKQKLGEQADAPSADLNIESPVIAPAESSQLTLQPQEPSADEQAQAAASAAAQETPTSSTSTLDYFSTTQVAPPSAAQASSLAQQQAELEADSGLTPRTKNAMPSSSDGMSPENSIGKTPAVENSARQSSTQQIAREQAVPVGGGTHGKLKIGLDEKQSAAIEAKKKLAARHAAKSVFVAKQSAPRRRVAIIAVLSLLILCAIGAYGYFNLMGLNQSPYDNLATTPHPSIQNGAELTPALDANAQNTDAIANPADPTISNADVTVAGTVSAPSTETDRSALPDAIGLSAADPSRPLTNAAPNSSAAAATTSAPTAASAIGTSPMPSASATPQTTASTNRDFAATATSSFNAASANSSTSLPSAQPSLSTMTRQSDAIQVRHTAATKQLNPHLSNAYQSYVAGDLGAAAAQYKTVLRQEPNNRDALLGVATIAIRRGQNAEAGSFYSRMLELNPNDTDASAGLASLDYNDPSKAESQLKNSLARTPDSSATLFALGNVYAEQSRWSEAQQAYFRAFGIAPENADYAYNLAISLDRLDQPKLALEYYQRALQLAHKNGGTLNKNAVTNRIQALQSLP